jgi:hypothetical protein
MAGLVTIVALVYTLGLGMAMAMARAQVPVQSSIVVLVCGALSPALKSLVCMIDVKLFFQPLLNSSSSMSHILEATARRLNTSHVQISQSPLQKPIIDVRRNLTLNATTRSLP